MGMDTGRWLADMEGLEREYEAKLANVRRMMKNVREGRDPNPPEDFG